MSSNNASHCYHSYKGKRVTIPLLYFVTSARMKTNIPSRWPSYHNENLNGYLYIWLIRIRTVISTQNIKTSKYFGYFLYILNGAISCVIVNFLSPPYRVITQKQWLYKKHFWDKIGSTWLLDLYLLITPNRLRCTFSDLWAICKRRWKTWILPIRFWMKRLQKYWNSQIFDLIFSRFVQFFQGLVKAYPNQNGQIILLLLQLAGLYTSLSILFEAAILFWSWVNVTSTEYPDRPLHPKTTANSLANQNNKCRSLIQKERKASPLMSTSESCSISHFLSLAPTNFNQNTSPSHAKFFVYQNKANDLYQFPLVSNQ